MTTGEGSDVGSDGRSVSGDEPETGPAVTQPARPSSKELTILPRPFGPFVLLERIGQGGMGVVWKAQERSSGNVIALKTLAGGELADESAKYRFHQEIQISGKLRHDNIIRLFGAPESESAPYYWMELAQGSLETMVDRFRAPGVAADLVMKVARAVAHAHERGVLHRDLKPSNILIDGKGEPLVADFGAALLINEDLRLTRTGYVVGTPGYMAPEQARGQDVTTAADVYSLGAILFRLLTGDVPPAPAGPGSAPHFPAKIDRDLKTICLKCLEEDPARRYRSAELVSEELGRYLRNEPIRATPASKARRLLHWLVRHPYLSVALLEGMLLLATLAVGGLFVVRDLTIDRRREILDANVYAAQALSGSVLFELKQYGDVVVRAATDPRLIQLLEDEIPSRPDLEKRLAEMADRLFFEGWYVLNADGTVLPRYSWSILNVDGTLLGTWPKSNRSKVGASFQWRDYFQGAKTLAHEGRRRAFVSRAYRDEADRKYKFGLSAPIYDAGGNWVGVALAAFEADSHLGALSLGDEHEKRRTALLISRLDNPRERASQPLPSDQIILLHQAVAAGAAVPISSDKVRGLYEALDQGTRSWRNQLELRTDALVAADERHLDPLSPGAERWLAGMAVVGSTDLVVVVQMPHGMASEPHQSLFRLLSWRAGMPFLLGSLLIALGSRWVRRHTRPSSSAPRRRVRDLMIRLVGRDDDVGGTSLKGDICQHTVGRLQRSSPT